MGGKHTKPATEHITGSQLAYLVVMNTIGPIILNGGINAALAYLLNMNTESLSVWHFDPTPIAGDIAVTIFIQQALTWVILGSMVCNDVRHAVVAPLASEPPRLLRTRLGWMTKIEDNILWEGRRAFARKFKRTVTRAAGFTVASFFLFWPVTVLILSIIEQTCGRIPVVPWYIVTKGVFGAVLSLTSPLVGYFALRSMGMNMRRPVADTSCTVGSPQLSVVIPALQPIEGDIAKDAKGLVDLPSESVVAQSAIL